MFMKSFFDLNVSQNLFDSKNCHSTLKHLYDFGYRTIAINHVIKDVSDEIESKKRKKKGQKQQQPDELIPEPVKIDEDLIKKFPDMKILTRLTLIFPNSDVYHKLCKSANFKKYDLLALLPLTMPALMFACSNIDADILTFDPETKSTLRINRKIYNQLISKGYYFELLYGPMIQDQNKRKNMIHLSHLYYTFGKSKNIIISSGISNLTYIRSPYDIINLGLILGLNEQKSKDSITHSTSNLCKKAFGRCHGKSIMFVENIENISEPIEIVEILDETKIIDEPSIVEISDSENEHLSKKLKI